MQAEVILQGPGRGLLMNAKQGGQLAAQIDRPAGERPSQLPDLG